VNPPPHSPTRRAKPTTTIMINAGQAMYGAEVCRNACPSHNRIAKQSEVADDNVRCTSTTKWAWFYWAAEMPREASKWRAMGVDGCTEGKSTLYIKRGPCMSM
jgi:hypothetical protein